MSTKIFIDPVTRLEGHLKIAITVNEVKGQQQVVDARATGTLFRGFEQLLVGRDPRDAQHLTQRICGVCPVPHGMVLVMAQDAAFRVTVPTNARIMRNLVLGANFVQSHLLHFYHLTALDYLDSDGETKLLSESVWGNVDITISGDKTPPVVTSFSIPSSSSTLTVPIRQFTATDNTAVTGYLVTTTSTKPVSSDPKWSSARPTGFTFTSTGTKRLYPWAKDAAGNVSSVSRYGTVMVLGNNQEVDD